MRRHVFQVWPRFAAIVNRNLDEPLFRERTHFPFCQRRIQRGADSGLIRHKRIIRHKQGTIRGNCFYKAGEWTRAQGSVQRVSLAAKLLVQSVAKLDGERGLADWQDARP